MGRPGQKILRMVVGTMVCDILVVEEVVGKDFNTT